MPRRLRSIAIAAIGTPSGAPPSGSRYAPRSSCASGSESLAARSTTRIGSMSRHAASCARSAQAARMSRICERSDPFGGRERALEHRRTDRERIDARAAERCDLLRAVDAAGDDQPLARQRLRAPRARARADRLPSRDRRAGRRRRSPASGRACSARRPARRCPRAWWDAPPGRPGNGKVARAGRPGCASAAVEIGAAEHAIDAERARRRQRARDRFGRGADHFQVGGAAAPADATRRARASWAPARRCP